MEVMYQIFFVKVNLENLEFIYMFCFTDIFNGS